MGKLKVAQRGLLTSDSEEEHSKLKFDDYESDLYTPPGDCSEASVKDFSLLTQVVKCG